MQNEQSLNFEPERGLGWRERLLVKALKRISHGHLELQLPGGSKREFVGDQPGPAARWVIRDANAFKRIIARGDIGFAEAYMAGEWETPRLVELLRLLDLNRDAINNVQGGRWYSMAADWLLHHWQRRNTRSGSRDNIAYHYDLGNDFYRLWLDESMTYSSAVFESAGQSLVDAQRHKYQRLIDMLEIGTDEHVLEIGSGWGGFAIQAATQTGCRVTSITLSIEQLQEARRRAEQAGVSDRVEFRLQDYRDVPETFDKIASIEMFEAVGEKFWPIYFKTVHDRLRPGGKAALQVITINNDDFDRYRKDVDFIQRYIFPGGMLPSPEVFAERVAQAGLLLEAQTFHGLDYAETLRRWDYQVMARRTAIQAQGYDERFMRMWHYYLAYCETGFVNQRTDVMQVLLGRPA